MNNTLEIKNNLNHSLSNPVCVSYLHADQVDSILHDSRILALIGFGRAYHESTDTRRFSVGLPQLGGDAQVEVWRTNESVTSEWDNGIACNFTSELLLGHLLLDEQQFADVVQTTDEAYRKMYALLERKGYTHLLRVWNYFPRINHIECGFERYQGFCLGRHDMLPDQGGLVASLPAASAIGTNSEGFQVYFLAATQPGLQIENPRQVSAFRYPKQYGPQSPSFSRAIFKRWGEIGHLYISGTASITGHQSRHRDDVLHQLNESLDNIECLIGEAHRREGLELNDMNALTVLKIYIRDPQDYEKVRCRIRERIAPAVPLLFLQGDICRQDLLIEIEGNYVGQCKM